MKGLITEKASVGFMDSKKTNEWVLNKAGVNRKLLDTVKARKLAYYDHTMKKQEAQLSLRDHAMRRVS